MARQALRRGSGSNDFDRITAPYGFVPLSPKVVRPPWVQPRLDTEGLPIVPPLHDRPFLDGVSGALVVELEAETPIFTRGGDDPQRFFRLPDGRFAVPGTALKGAIRNVVEIATFSRMGRVNDHRYAVRDLHNRELYGRFMTEIVRNPRTGTSEPMPLVNAGWLSRDSSDAYTITVCDFARIEYGLLENLAGERGVARFHPGRKQSSVRKYEAWGSASREVSVQVALSRPDVVGNRRLLSGWGKVSSVGSGRAGVLVFTGQPAEYRPGPRRRGGGNAKHHDFVFLPPADGSPRILPVAGEVFRDFELAHSDRGQQNKLGRSESPNEEWAYWQKQLERGARVPVFFLTDENGTQVRSFGLAMMFRLPYRNSIGEALERIHPSAEASLDFAEGLFGTVQGAERRRATVALKGRVAFSHAVASGQIRELDAVSTVLGAPRASYYPNYVEQDPEVPGAQPPADAEGKPRYTTWQDDFGRPRGWKRYRTLTRTWIPEPPRGAGGRELDQERVATTFRPLEAGARFRSRLVLHNVRPVELGALLWALDFGSDATARHAIGMARPLGFGRVRMRIVEADLSGIDGTKADLDRARTAFTDYMRKEIPGWEECVQIEALLNLARPVEPEEARYQRLDPGARVNEFVDAKKKGLVLPAAHRVTGRAALRIPGAGRRPAKQEPRGRDGRAGQARGRRRGPAAVVSPVAAISAARARWPGMRRGDRLKVQLVELNKKGKWRARAIDHDAIGTIEGNPPDDAAPEQEHEVEILQGSDPRNLNLKWRE